MSSHARQHTPRMDFRKLVPEISQALLDLDEVVLKGMDQSLKELVKIRASQLNKCAFCINMHVKAARKAGESDARLDLLHVWEETSGVYTDKERAALALTETITELDNGVPDAAYDRAAEHFEDRELAQLISLILTINSWNRLMITTRMQPLRWG